jgi:two-component system response regulator YesN
VVKVLIVDDDSIARTNIKTMVDWTQNGFEVCGEASNGEAAILAIRDSLPDIVITDMSMPAMNGIELIDYIVKNFPNIKVIALSGYDEYNYIRQSMKNGAVDYILKHTLNGETLLNVLNIARHMIIQDQEENENKCRIQEQIIKSRDIMKKELIRQLALGGIDEMGEIRQKIDTLCLDLDIKNLVVVAVEIDDFHFLQEKLSAKGMNKLISSFIDISTEILNDMGKAVISNIDRERFIIIFSLGYMRSNLQIHDYIMTAIDRIRASIKRYLNITACFSISNTIDTIVDLHKYYKKAEEALNGKFFKGKNTVFQGKMESKPESEALNLDINDEKMIVSSLKSLDRQSFQNIIKKIFDDILLYKISQRSIKMICAELISIVNRVARESGIDTGRIYQNDDIPYDEMKKYETITDVEQWILDIYDKLFRMLQISRINPNYNEPTKKAIEFVQKNYGNNISLNDAADYISVSSSYLSRIFKKDCGKGFNEYLNYVRVEHAKLFIESGDYKLKDIVKKVGFNNYTYFFKVFKDFIGMTPQEYEEVIKSKMSGNTFSFS